MTSSSRTCARCGQESPEGSLACRECGNPFPPARPGLAKIALVLGVLSYPLLCAFGVGVLTALLSIVLGVLALLRRPREGSGAAVGAIALGALCLGGAVLLALPGMLTARVAEYERQAIEDIRTVQKAELEYAEVNGEYYDTLACLGAPARCIPGYRGSRSAFLTPELAAAGPRMGYVRSLHPGAAPPQRKDGVSPTSVAVYAYIAVPEEPGRTGRRSFCGDVSGRICALPAETRPTLDPDGLCAPSCPDLR